MRIPRKKKKACKKETLKNTHAKKCIIIKSSINKEGCFADLKF
jgi:hypothetical protein